MTVTSRGKESGVGDVMESTVQEFQEPSILSERYSLRIAPSVLSPRASRVRTSSVRGYREVPEALDHLETLDIIVSKAPSKRSESSRENVEAFAESINNIGSYPCLRRSRENLLELMARMSEGAAPDGHATVVTRAHAIISNPAITSSGNKRDREPGVRPPKIISFQINFRKTPTTHQLVSFQIKSF